MQTVSAGLRDIVAADSTICEVNGEEGQLCYRGYDIHDLAEHATFEEVAYLIWNGDLPNREQLSSLKRQLAEYSPLSPDLMHCLESFPKNADSMDALRTAVSALAMNDPDRTDKSPAANMRRAIRLTAQISSIVAAQERMRQHLDPIAPDKELSFAGNFLHMLFNKKPDPLYERTFDMALILHADHELNASTFAARVTVATLADIYSGIVSAIATLSGPLHGGANERVMEMLFQIGDVENVADYIQPRLERHERIPGFGHAVYKAPDPRAAHLREMSRKVGELTGNTKWYEMTQAIEKIVTEERKEKKVYANVDCFSGSCYYSMGIPIRLFTPIFAMGRIVGWTAHIMEQYADNKLIRPRAEYVGERNRSYVPIGQRA